MDDQIIRQLKAEEATLARKLHAVRELLTLYGGAAVSESTPSPAASKRGGQREKVEITGFTEASRQSVALAMEALLHGTPPIRTRNLVSYIEARGHEISGNDKINALGALLGRSADIISHGKSGWSLADRERALDIVAAHAPKENEAHSGFAGASDAGNEGGPTPSYPWRNPQSGYTS